MPDPSLAASVVLFDTPAADIENVVATLLAAPEVGALYLLDNSPVPLKPTLPDDPRLTYRPTGSNLGYGRGHNVALRDAVTRFDYHLVLNADTSFDPAIIGHICGYLDANPDVASIAPRVRFADGRLQRLCKLLPEPADVIGRRFLPGTAWGRRRNERYELAGFGYDRPANIPFLSGSFVAMRTEALRKVGLFDERYFLYAEDLDLSRRLHRHYRTMFLPDIEIIHRWVRTSHRSWSGTYFALRSHAQYFNKWGWFRDPERDEVNRRALAALDLL